MSRVWVCSWLVCIQMHGIVHPALLRCHQLMYQYLSRFDMHFKLTYWENRTESMDEIFPPYRGNDNNKPLSTKLTTLNGAESVQLIKNEFALRELTVTKEFFSSIDCQRIYFCFVTFNYFLSSSPVC